MSKVGNCAYKKYFKILTREGTSSVDCWEGMVYKELDNCY